MTSTPRGRTCTPDSSADAVRAGPTWEAGSRGLVQLRSPGRRLVCRTASPDASLSRQACALEPQLWDMESTPGSAPPSPSSQQSPALVPFPNPAACIQARAAEFSAQVAKTKVRKSPEGTLLEPPLCAGREQKPHPHRPREAPSSQCGTSSRCGRRGKGTS